MIGDTNSIASSSHQTTVLDITVTGANNLISGGTVTVMMGGQLIAEDITDTMGKCTIQLGLTNGQMTISYDKDGESTEQTVNVAIGVTTQVFLTIVASFTFTMNYNASNFVSSPNNCLTYAGGCAGFTPVSGPGNPYYVAKCTEIGSWVMNEDGTSSNKLLDKCFYATVADSGVLYEKLNPQDLTKKIAKWNLSTKEWVPATGSSSITTYNTMFCIPTIYVSSTSTSITLSEKEKEGSKPFAHTIDNHVYQYMAIGVYPANGSSTRLKSISGATSTVNISQEDLVAGCRANKVVGGKAMLCNWFQWQLYRLLVLFSIRHFNSQEKIGQGGQTNGAKTTGLMNAMGPFAGSSNAGTSDTQGVKAFIENPWGHNAEFLGDFKYEYDRSDVYAWQTSTQNSTYVTDGGIIINESPYSLKSPYQASGTISTEPETWGWGTGGGGSGTTGGCDYQSLPSSSYPFGIVGGPSSNVGDRYAGVSYLNFGNGGATDYSGGRLVFVFDIDGGGNQ